jgi:hypothetical protein
MEPIAGGDLCNLHCDFLGITQESKRQLRTIGKDFQHLIGIYSQSGSRTLCNSSVWVGAKSCDQGQSDKTFPTAQPNFDTFSVNHDVQNRSHHGIREVAVRDWLSFFMKEIVQFKIHQGQLVGNELPFLARQTQQ